MRRESREGILGRVRQARTAKEIEHRKADMNAYIARHAQGPQSSSNWDLVTRFKERALGLLSSVDEASGMQDVPDVAARYFNQNGLPRGAVCWPGL
ncbi:MAG: lactate utilization protein C, partial [Burkholderiales bacterium]